MSKKTNDEFVSEMKKVNSNIVLKNAYRGVKEKINCECLICGNVWSATADNLLQGKGCPMCAKRKTADSKKMNFMVIESSFKERGLELLTKESDIITTITRTKLLYICPKHGVQTILWNNFKKGAGCRKCADEKNRFIQLKKFSVIEQYFKFKTPYILLSNKSEYIGANVSCLRYLCEEHGEQIISWTNIQKGERCPICNSSKGEIKITDYLSKISIDYQSQKTFNNLLGINNGNLSYDFYIPSLKLLIEYQGIQHSEPVDFNGFGKKCSEKQFIKQQEHDRRKREYAKSHGYELLEIWYYDFNKIEEILSKALGLNSLST